MAEALPHLPPIKNPELLQTKFYVLLFIILFVYISNEIPLFNYPFHQPSLSHAIPLPGYRSSSPTNIHPPPFLSLYENATPNIHTLPPHCSSIPLYWGIKSPQDQRPLLPLLLGKVILCDLCIWSHGFLQVYSLVGGLDFVRTGWSGQTVLFFQWGCNSPFLPQSFCQLLHQVA